VVLDNKVSNGLLEERDAFVGFADFDLLSNNESKGFGDVIVFRSCDFRVDVDVDDDALLAFAFTFRFGLVLVLDEEEDGGGG